jgi:hypothetical protein
MSEGIQGQAPDQNKLKQMMEAAQGTQKPKSINKDPKPQGESGLIKSLEETSTEVAKKVGEGIMKLINPMVWFATAMSLTRPILAQVDDRVEDGYGKFSKFF